MLESNRGLTNSGSIVGDADRTDSTGHSEEARVVGCFSETVVSKKNARVRVNIGERISYLANASQNLGYNFVKCRDKLEHFIIRQVFH
jgi:hypothetical protein